MNGENPLTSLTRRWRRCNVPSNLYLATYCLSKPPCPAVTDLKLSEPSMFFARETASISRQSKRSTGSWSPHSDVIKRLVIGRSALRAATGRWRAIYQIWILWGNGDWSRSALGSTTIQLGTASASTLFYLGKAMLYDRGLHPAFHALS